jgi:hypothetical protein
MVVDIEVITNKLKELNKICKLACEQVDTRLVVAGGMVQTDPIPYAQNLHIISSINDLNGTLLELKYKTIQLQ